MEGADEPVRSTAHPRGTDVLAGTDGPSRFGHAVTEDEGTARGARRILVPSGELAFDLHTDRARDIGPFSFRGVPLAWISPTGFAVPGLRDESTMGWLRTFGGGLVATCGLDAFGSPSRDAAEDFPLHGRVGMTPAEQVGHDARWTAAGTFEIVVTGKVRQARVFGENLLLCRTAAPIRWRRS